jgi:hypothetical protein
MAHRKIIGSADPCNAVRQSNDTIQRKFAHSRPKPTDSPAPATGSPPNSFTLANGDRAVAFTDIRIPNLT